MAWGFRKSFGTRGLRFTISKSGISTSVGGKGLRLTSGPRGVHVTTGVGGFYYRKRLDTRPSKRPAPPPPQALSSAIPFELPEPSSLGEESSFVEELERTTRGGTGASALRMIAGGLLSALAIFHDFSLALWAVPAFCGLCVLDRVLLERSRRFAIDYELGDRAEVFEELKRSLLGLGEHVRAVVSDYEIADTRRHAGAKTGIDLSGAAVGLGLPRHVLSNVEPAWLSLGGLRLYLLPDRILIERDGRFGAVSYGSLQLATGRSAFVWSRGDPPAGASIVMSRWRYSRKDGGPDRRFSDNRLLPVIEAGFVELSAPTGLRIELMHALPERLDMFVAALRSYADTFRQAEDAAAAAS